MKFEIKILPILLMATIADISTGQETFRVPVKRVHSRQRRFIAPGAVWDLMIGIEVIGSDFELRYNLVTHYNMDYLFGGTAALAGAIAAADAAVQASKDARVAAQAAVNAGRTIRAADGGGVAAALGRSFKTNDDISNLLSRTIIDDQIDILGKIEGALDKGGMSGKQCVLRAICELSETPIHHWTVFGEMLTNLLRPKNGTHESLEDYKRAEKIGEEQGDCWSFYPECPISIFNVIPDVYTTDDHVEVSFDGFESGSKYEPSENSIDDDIVNAIKDGMKIKEHTIDLDFTT